MTDYFSRLAQQTGINVEPELVPGGELSEEAPLESAQAPAIPSVEVQETEAVEASAVHMSESSDGTVHEEAEPATRPSAGDVGDRAKGSQAATTPAEFRSNDAASTRTARQDEELETSGGRKAEGAEPRGVERAASQNQPLAEEPKRETPIEHELLGRDEPRRSVPSALAPTPSMRKQVLGDRRNTSIPREELLRTVLREVRHWVAIQPALTTEEQRGRVAAEITGRVEEALETAPDDERFETRHADAEAKRAGEIGVEAPDVHLSIGPINVTIENPEREASAHRPPPPQYAGEMHSSRLSRRYVVP